MKRFALHAVALLALTACTEPTRPAAPADRPAFSTLASIACPASPTFTVSDEASLRAALAAASPGARSEEHTSELQSRLHLVCRLLLEKKKNIGRRVSAQPTRRG